MGELDNRVILGRASPRERELFGIPAVGHDHWNEQTMTGVAGRYPDMGMTPHRERMNHG